MPVLGDAALVARGGEPAARRIVEGLGRIVPVARDLPLGRGRFPDRVAAVSRRDADDGGVGSAIKLASAACSEWG